MQNNLICSHSFLFCALFSNELANEEYEKYLNFGRKHNHYVYNANDHITIEKKDFSENSIMANLYNEKFQTGS